MASTDIAFKAYLQDKGLTVPDPPGQWMFDLTRNSKVVQEIIGPSNRFFTNSCFKDPNCLKTDSLNYCCYQGDCACPK